MAFPSGDHASASGAGSGGPMAVCPTQMRDFPSRSEIQARRPPSGDQRGERSRHSPFVICRRSRPSDEITHKLENEVCRDRSLHPSTYTTWLPSEVILGSSADLHSHKSDGWNG